MTIRQIRPYTLGRLARRYGYAKTLNPYSHRAWADEWYRGWSDEWHTWEVEARKGKSVAELLEELRPARGK